jgi:2'-5' RNA ligase
MYYCVVYFLEGNVSKIEEFRKKHGDFTSNVVRAHVTLVFPIATAKIGEEDLKKHVENIASNFRGFNANFSGFEKSWDNWLFLSVKEGFGRTEFVSLHDELYTGIVSPYLRKDLPFSPHISLALLKKGPRLFDTFTKDGKTSYAFRMVFQSNTRTLVEQEITDIMNKITASLQNEGWEVR